MLIERSIKYRLPFSFCKECKRFSPYNGGCLKADGCKAAVRLYKKYMRRGKEVLTDEERSEA